MYQMSFDCVDEHVPLAVDIDGLLLVILKWLPKYELVEVSRRGSSPVILKLFLFNDPSSL